MIDITKQLLSARLMAYDRRDAIRRGDAMRSKILGFFLTLVPLCGASAQGSSISLPDAIFAQTLSAADCAGYQFDCGIGDPITEVYNALGKQSFSASSAVGAGTVATSIATRLGPTVQSRSLASGYGEGSGTAQVVYSFQVLGPTPTTVPVIADFNGRLVGRARSNNNYDEASVTAWLTANGTNDGVTDTVDFALSCPMSAACSTYDSGQYAFTVTSSTEDTPAPPSTVTLAAITLAEPVINAANRAAALANLRSSLIIDPSWPNASLYTIQISAGLTQ